MGAGWMREVDSGLPIHHQHSVEEDWYTIPTHRNGAL